VFLRLKDGRLSVWEVQGRPGLLWKVGGHPRERKFNETRASKETLYNQGSRCYPMHHRFQKKEGAEKNKSVLMKKELTKGSESFLPYPTR